MTGVKQLSLDILVLDDESEFRETVVRRLLRRGYSVAGEPTSFTPTGRAFDLVIVRHSPLTSATLDSLAINGFRQPSMQVIVICGREVLETQIESLPRNATDLLTKPLIWSELDWRVQRAAERIATLRSLGNRAESVSIQAATSAGQDLPSAARQGASVLSADALAAVQRSHILEILRREGGNKARTARALGVNRRSLYRLIEKFQIQISEGSVGGAYSTTGDR